MYNNDSNQALLDKVCNFIITGFIPATSMQDAELLYSTEELRNIITQHLHEDISGAIIYDALIQCDYSYITINTKTKWMLKKW